ncbi:MAG: hypothetical protein JRI23_36870 [Deltaproteobacteria bacterium]|jgi:hypothetical protein|nr:hypothetical protein [Deltaproteobacteria bacterium]MBW2537956.1 hypothetical protein [Deltaproteobacteria bacterium]
MARTEGLRRLSVTSLALALLGIWLAPACEPLEIVQSPDGGTAAGGALPYDGGSADADADANGGQGPGLDAGTGPVLVGLSPNPAGAGGGLPSEAEALAARLTTFAVGVRTVVVARSWQEVSTQGIDALSAEVASYRARDLAVVLNLLVIDRYADHRPPAVAGLAWNAPATVTALEATVDTLLDALGAQLHALVLSRETDAYLVANPEQASGLVELMSAVILHAEAYADGEPRSGVGLSFVGLSPSAAYRQLLELGQLAVWSYQPGLGEEQVPNDTSTANDLDTMIDLAGTKPIVLLAAGASTDDELGATEEGQRHFLASLFGALEARRSHFDLVNVDELHDRGAGTCAALAASRGELPDGPYASYTCRSGLKGVDGEPKPAWLSFIEGAAAFASP